MAKPFKNLLAKMPPESRERIAAKSQALEIEMRLTELREAAEKTQTEIAKAMGIQQANVSYMENGRRGLMLSTLAKYLEAVGAELVVSARFKDGDVRLSLDTLAPRTTQEA